MDASTLLLAPVAVAAACVLALAVARRDGRAAAHAAAGASAAALLAVGGAGAAGATVACLLAAPFAALWLLVGGRPGVRGAGPAEGVAWVAGLSLLAIALVVPVHAVLPDARVAVPAPGPAGWALGAATVALLIPVARRTLREWRLGRRDAELSEFAGTVLLAVVAAGIAAGGAARPALAVVGAIAATAVTAPSWIDLRRLPAIPRDGVLRAQGVALGAQTAALAEHARPGGPLPVAWLSVATGERLGMSPGHLGRLAREAILRDLGKRTEPGVRADELGTGASIGGVIFAAERYLRLTRTGGMSPSQALAIQRQDPDGVSPTVPEALEAALESGLHVTHRPAAAPFAPVPVPVAAERDDEGTPGP